MKVGEHRVNDTKAIAGQDEEPCPSLPRSHATIRSSTFEHPDASGTDRDHPSALPVGLIDRACRCLVDPVPLAMDSVFRRIIDADGPEGIEADVQRHKGNAHPAIADRRQ